MLLDGWVVYRCMYVWRIVYRWLDVLILVVVVVVAGGRLADGLQRERLVGAQCRRSERTLPGELHAASGVRSLLGWRKPDSPPSCPPNPGDNFCLGAGNWRLPPLDETETLYWKTSDVPNITENYYA